jgi:hypothetical protein
VSEQEQVGQPLRVPVPRQRTLTRADIAGQLETITGRRAVLANADGPWRDYRVWGEVEVRAQGFQGTPEGVRTFPFVPVVSERAWWAWRLQGRRPHVVWWPAGAVWVEDEGEPPEG